MAGRATGFLPMPLSPLSSATLLNTFSGQYVGIGADCSGPNLLLVTPARSARSSQWYRSGGPDRVTIEPPMSIEALLDICTEYLQGSLCIAASPWRVLAEQSPMIGDGRLRMIGWLDNGTYRWAKNNGKRYPVFRDACQLLIGPSTALAVLDAPVWKVVNQGKRSMAGQAPSSA
ncbi:hypothetical protein VTN49DRAFT_7842 [Thermomyces lanuginosus]|uniref:uncharacterized protein n=1 Tax=Thermomyces lanuginosus TaxID=5541 RepID=UPI003743FB92